ISVLGTLLILGCAAIHWPADREYGDLSFGSIWGSGPDRGAGRTLRWRSAGQRLFGPAGPDRRKISTQCLLDRARKPPVSEGRFGEVEGRWERGVFRTGRSASQDPWESR